MNVPQTASPYEVLSKELDGEFSPALIKTVFQTIMPEGATYEHMDLFLRQCVRTGLDPISGQITPAMIRGKLTIITRIDGFRAIAERTGQLDGEEGPFFCGEDGVWVDVWLREHPPMAAKIIVYRKGASRGFAGVALWSEYCQYNRKGEVSGAWATHPTVMIAKCAEAAAKRKAFPNDLSGLYAFEEMGREEKQGGGQKPAGRPVPEPKVDSSPEPAPTPVEEGPVTQGIIEKCTIPGPDDVTYIEMPRDAKVPCDFCGVHPKKGEEVAHAKREDGTYFVAHKQEYIELLDEQTNPNEPVDAEFEDVPEDEPEPEKKPAPKKKKAAAKKKKASAKKKTAAEKAAEETKAAVEDALEKHKEKNPALRKLTDTLGAEPVPQKQERDDSDLPF